MSELKLTPGSRYRITSVTALDQVVTNEGTFQGFVGLGNVDSLILEVEEEGRDEPLTRLIPAHTVRMLDVLEAAGGDEDDDETEYLHYG